MRHVLMTQTDDELLDDAQQISTAPALDRLHSRERERERENVFIELCPRSWAFSRGIQRPCAWKLFLLIYSCCSRVHIHLLVIYCRSLHKRIIPRQQTIYTAAACWARVLSYFIYVYIFDPPTPHSAIYCDVLLVVVPSPLPVSVQHSKYKESMV